MQSISKARARVRNAEQKRMYLAEMATATRKRLDAIEKHLSVATTAVEAEKTGLDALLATAEVVGKIPDSVAGFFMADENITEAKAAASDRDAVALARAINPIHLARGAPSKTEHPFQVIDRATHIARSVPKYILNAAAARRKKIGY